MLSIGENKIQGMYLGSGEIQRAYLGEALVFEKAPEAEPVTVYVTIESYRNSAGESILETRVPVTFRPKRNRPPTAADALMTMQAGGETGLRFMNDGGKPLAAGDSYMAYVQSGSGIYGPADGEAYVSWMCRVNEQLMLWEENPGADGLKGAVVSAAVSDGDYLHFYMDNVQSMLTCAKYTRLTTSYRRGTLTVNIQESHSWFDAEASGAWNLTDFTAYAVPGAAVSVYQAGSDTPLAAGTANGSAVTIRVTLTAGETYMVVVDSVFSESEARYACTSASIVFTV